MASKKPSFLNKSKKRQTSSPSSSSSSSTQQTTVSLFDPVDHALHLESHLSNTTKSIKQSETTAKDWIQAANTVNKEIDSIIEKRPDDQELKKMRTSLKQLIMTFNLLSSKITELEKVNNENQVAFEVFKSSTFEYLLGTIYNDVELISQFEQPIKDENIKLEKQNSDTESNSDLDPDFNSDFDSNTNTNFNNDSNFNSHNPYGSNDDIKKIKKDPSFKKRTIRRGLLPSECR
jgi:hypothetical protein